jgi:hypothetical protein
MATLDVIGAIGGVFAVLALVDAARARSLTVRGGIWLLIAAVFLIAASLRS